MSGVVKPLRAVPFSWTRRIIRKYFDRNVRVICFFLFVYRPVGSHVLQNQKTEKRSALVRRHREQDQLAVRVDALPTRAAEQSFGRGNRSDDPSNDLVGLRGSPSAMAPGGRRKQSPCFSGFFRF